ncbi:TIGR04222 domain-containing membrane protein [Scandinavium goeteborgense]|uniref:TIGR04222 domain-containing membrane protein n=1 Tax=Scandinavium goeteborgense TaxID=1851514 RepID=UPI0021658871|nr:TIGR04222 domain-containing membrane protein [Scandinavium goeteborgense]
MNVLYWSGPSFLFFYICVVICVFFMTGKLFRKREEQSSPPLQLSGELDVLFISWLKSRGKGVLELIAGLLIERGFLEDMGDGQLIRTDKVKSADDDFSEYEEKILMHYSTSNSLLSSTNLITPLTKGYYELAVRKHMLLTEKQLSSRRKIAACGVTLMLLLGAAKLYIALSTGHHNVLYLVLCMIFSCVIYYFVFISSSRGMVNSRYGKDYIDRLILPLSEEVKPEIKMLVCILVGQSIISSTVSSASDSYINSSSDVGGGSSCGGSGCGGCGGD